MKQGQVDWQGNTVWGIKKKRDDGDGHGSGRGEARSRKVAHCLENKLN